MRGLTLSLTAILPLLFSASIQAAIISYDGDETPDSATYGPDFTTIVFGGTSWSSDGDVLTMTTAPSRGIWFGYWGGADTPSTWSPSNNAVGNQLDGRLALDVGATEWSMYIHDADGHFASFGINNGSVTMSNGNQSSTLALDTSQFHDYTIHLRNGVASFGIDGLLKAQLTGGAVYSPSIVLVGDGSGSTPTGVGSFFVDSFSIDTNPGAHTLVASEPALSIVAALVGMVLSRRRKVRS